MIIANPAAPASSPITPYKDILSYSIICLFNSIICSGKLRPTGSRSSNPSGIEYCAKAGYDKQI